MKVRAKKTTVTTKPKKQKKVKKSKKIPQSKKWRDMYRTVKQHGEALKKRGVKVPKFNTGMSWEELKKVLGEMHNI